MKPLIFIFIMLISVLLPAQNADSVITEKIYTFTEVIPEFSEGKIALEKFISSNLIYPQDAIDNCISGYVTIQCLIEKDGSISSTSVVKSIGYGCDEEAIRIIQNMPVWKPAKQSGELVRSYWRIPIKFELAADCTPVPKNDK